MADELLDRSFGQFGLDARERALCVELTYGALRHQAALDWRLDRLADRPMPRLPIPVRTALRLGAYQLLYLEKIPPSAAVNESVELVRHGQRGALKSYAGFVNAVLRALTREPPPSWPDPKMDPVAALSIRYSCPSWLAERWLSRFGFERAESACHATLTIPPLTLRTNTLRQTREGLMAGLAQAGLEVRATAVSPIGLVVEKCGSVTNLPQFQQGSFYIEDEAGQLIPPILDPQPGERVLDACAAPGGKSTHLAALMQNRGEIVAMDRSQKRLRLLEENCKRLGASIISPFQGDLAEQDNSSVVRALRARPFDCILVDAPCSGFGVLKRHPEAKWQKSPEDLPRLQATQLQLLHQVSTLLRPGGRLVYSTCSTEPEENEEVIEQFCGNHPEFRRERVESWLPTAGRSLLTSRGDLSTVTSMQTMDAFFACRLRKADR